MISYGEEIQFKWDPSQPQNGPLGFIVEVFEYESGYIAFPDNPA